MIFLLIFEKSFFRNTTFWYYFLVATALFLVEAAKCGNYFKKMEMFQDFQFSLSI